MTDLFSLHPKAYQVALGAVTVEVVRVVGGLEEDQGGGQVVGQVDDPVEVQAVEVEVSDPSCQEYPMALRMEEHLKARCLSIKMMIANELGQDFKRKRNSKELQCIF